LRPELYLRVAMVSANNPHVVEARGYPRASKEDEGPRELTPAFGRLTAGERDRPLHFGVDQYDLPNDPNAGWPGMSGSAVLLQEWPDPDTIWIYGVVQAVPVNFDSQLKVARLAEVWQERGSKVRTLLVAAGAPDEDAEDPSRLLLASHKQKLTNKSRLALLERWIKQGKISAADKDDLSKVLDVYQGDSELDLPEISHIVAMIDA
jgi:hypothetical protein